MTIDDPDASEEKKLAEESKSPLQKIVGFRILGYRVSNILFWWFLSIFV